MNDMARGANARRMLAAGLVLVSIILAFFIGRATSPTTEHAVPNEGQKTLNEPGPTDLINGVPVGYAPTKEGATAAAFEFARIMAGGQADSSAYRLVMETLAAPSWKNRARELAENSAQFVQDEYGVGGAVSFYPLRYQVTDFAETSATIELWGVALAAGRNSSRADEAWLIGEVSLAWVNGDWRVTAQRSEPGPTPLLLQNQQGSSFDRVDGFREFESAPGD